MSNGPWLRTPEHYNHVKEDNHRLNRFLKDAYKYTYSFLKSNYVRNIDDTLDKMKFISMHFHEEIMEINILQRDFPPFLVARKFCTIELPLKNSSDTNRLANTISLLCERLLTLNCIIKENIYKINQFNVAIDKTYTTPPNQIIRTLEPGSGGSVFTTFSTPN